MPVRITELQASLPIDVQTERVYERVRDVIEVAPLTKTELADELGVSQTAVSQWASGDSRPSLEQAVALLDIVGERLKRIRHQLVRAREAVEVGREAVEARRRYEESREKEDLDRYSKLGEKAREILGTSTKHE